jgi:hypothetical protein
MEDSSLKNEVTDRSMYKSTENFWDLFWGKKIAARNRKLSK